MNAVTRRRRRRQTGGSSFDFLKPFIRFWGLLTAIVVCGVGVDILMHGHQAGVYILLASALIFLLEIKWIITLFVELCISHDSMSSCGDYWGWTAVAGGWRLAPLYVAIGVALIIWHFHLWLSYVAGVQLIFLAILRLCTLLRRTTMTIGGLGLLGKGDRLLNHQYESGFENKYADDYDDQLQSVHSSLEDEEPIDDL